MKDKIFLLSVDEYCKYVDKIPCCFEIWWLRTTYKPSQFQYAFDVNDRFNGIIDATITYDDTDNSYAARPALNLNGLTFETREFEYLGIKWRKISDCLAIAKEPIFKSVFSSNSKQDYRHSEIRKKLLAWYKERLADTISV